MRTNPYLPDRKTLRLKGYDYSREGAYFITICCQDRKHRFGKVIDGIMHLNDCGRIAHDEWEVLIARYPHCHFDVFQIMPNHMHGIVVIGGPTLSVGRSNDHLDDHWIIEEMDNSDEMDHPKDDVHHPNLDDGDHPLDDGTTARVVRASIQNASISDMMGAYKSIVSVKCLEIYKAKGERMGKLWQRSFDDKIIRDERAYLNISNYIINNPRKWSEGRCK